MGYHDNTPANQGGEYRPHEGVDLFVSPDPFGGGSIVRFFENGEWLAYTIEVPTSGDYQIELRVVTHPDFPDSAFHVEVDGVDVTGMVVLPSTGPVNNYQWLGRTTIPLAEGKRVLKIVSERQFFDLNAIRISHGAVSFSCSFENAPADCGFVEEAKQPPRRAKLRHFARDGKSSVRLHTEPGDTDVAGSGPSSERNDLALRSIATDCFEGQEQWWAHSLLFPNDYVAPPAGGFGVVFNFHHNGSFGQANFHVDATFDGLRLRGYGGESVNTGENSVGEYLSEWLGAVEKNLWHDFVYHVRWSSSSDGFFIAWLRKGSEPVGRKVLEHYGPTLYRGMGCFLKLANYHLAFGEPSSVVHDRVIRGTTPESVSLTPLEGVP
ncbi:MAG TPA: heparin lyase I family protein [Polyangiaceae bacterium]|nr:heparin lyase I family protein [Polyangiaceae bacterium]